MILCLCKLYVMLFFVCSIIAELQLALWLQKNFGSEQKQKDTMRWQS